MHWRKKFLRPNDVEQFAFWLTVGLLAAAIAYAFTHLGL